MPFPTNSAPHADGTHPCVLPIRLTPQTAEHLSERGRFDSARPSTRLARVFRLALGLLCLSPFLPIDKATAQVVCTGDYDLESQAEVDAFGTLGCTEVTGRLTIGSTALTDISDLTPLATMSSVGASLVITRNPNLVSVSPLQNLASIGTDLFISVNETLATLNGLDNLTGVDGEVSVVSNPALTSLSGLDNLTTVGQGLKVIGNDGLTSVSGLENLASVGRSVEIGGNPNLTSLIGLAGLSSIGWDLSISNNDNLTSLSGLANLTAVDRNLLILMNDGLTSLQGLEDLTTIGAAVLIFYNNMLASLNGLQNITSIGFNLGVESNPNLASCSCGLTGVITADGFTGVDGIVSIADNDPAGQCISPEAVLANPCSVEATTTLIDDVEALGLPDGLTNALTQKLRNALTDLANGDPDGAVAKLRAFINQVEAQRGKKLTDEEADALIAAAEAIIAEIEADAPAAARLAAPARLESAAVPERFGLDAAYPNPFNPSTTVGFAVAERGEVRVAVFDLLGRERAVLAAGVHEAGRYTAVFEAGELPSGTYLVRMTTPAGAFTHKVLLMK